jgi:hypothetical protein
VDSTCRMKVLDDPGKHPGVSLRNDITATAGSGADRSLADMTGVFMFQAWKALGRVVRHGEHGVRIATFIECKSREIDRHTGEAKLVRWPVCLRL